MWHVCILLFPLSRNEDWKYWCQIKNKMLDSQNDSIRDLKSEIVSLKKCIADKVAAMETMERKLEEERDKVLRKFLYISFWFLIYSCERDLIFQVHELQNELAEEEIIFSQIEEELKREKKANVEAEIAKSSLLTKLSEKDELLKYVLILMHENVYYVSEKENGIVQKGIGKLSEDSYITFINKILW